MAVEWTPQEIVEVVRRHLASQNFDHRELIDRVDIVNHEIQVVLRRVGVRHGPHAIRYSLARLPVGPCTGEVCDSVDQWAIEVAWDLDEVIGTRAIEAAEQRTEPDGLVLLRWWQGEGWSR